jgi:hypothetical protein
VAIHDRPRCWLCVEIVEHDPIFAAPCDHDRCPSVVFHGLCLMEWREWREKRVKILEKWVAEHRQSEQSGD